MIFTTTGFDLTDATPRADRLASGNIHLSLVDTGNVRVIATGPTVTPDAMRTFAAHIIAEAYRMEMAVTG